MRTAIALGVMLVAGCSIQKQGFLAGPGRSSGGQSSEASEDPGAERERMAQHHAEQGPASLDEGMFLRHEFDALQGLTVADAKAKARSFGHTGDVRLTEEDTYVEGCAPGTVCRATNYRGDQGGMDEDDELLLWTNKTVTISGPPE